LAEIIPPPHTQTPNSEFRISYGVEEGERTVESLLKLEPDFAGHGHILIGHYMKFEDIVERVIDGLQKSGLKVGDYTLAKKMLDRYFCFVYKTN